MHALLALLLIAPPALPERIFLKTPTRSFTASHLLALEDGRLWWRPNPDTTGQTEPWALVPPDGLPIARGRLEALKELLPGAPEPFARPQRLTQLTADGENVIVVGEGGVVYYAKLPALEWTALWGPAGLKKPLKIDFLHRSLAISHRKHAYEDLDGNPHPVTAGVTTFYSLSADGRGLRYTDPWLPGGFDRRLCLPLRNQFAAAMMSASASTLFVIDAAGRSFTRLADFDTTGLDPALPYSWERERRSGLRSIIRSLPAEEWLAQPPLPGKATTRITVLQTGAGNAARELRVEGENGYWKKAIRAPKWDFVTTGEPAIGEWIDPGLPLLTPPKLPVLKSSSGPLNGELRDFDPLCSPARVWLTRDKDAAEFELHFLGEGDHLSGALIATGPSKTQARRLLNGKHWAAVEIELTSLAVVVSDRTFQLQFLR